jgi:hypothetical protein
VTVVYDGEHEAVRRALLAVYQPSDPCRRCGRPLGPNPARIDLGHRDDGAGWSGLEHARCNRQAGARLGHARRRARRERKVRMVTEVAVALEISEDRQHTSVVAAGRLEGDLVLVDLVRYVVGTDAVPAVLEVRSERTVLVVVVDPHSHAATAIAPLEAAGVAVTRPSSADLVVAHGGFLDLLAAGGVRHQGQAELTTAVRHLEQRRLGGATAPERRGAPVDVAPAVAAELAVWGLQNAPPPRTPFFLTDQDPPAERLEVGGLAGWPSRR